jgi:hypothetical protein
MLDWLEIVGLQQFPYPSASIYFPVLRIETKTGELHGSRRTATESLQRAAGWLSYMERGKKRPSTATKNYWQHNRYIAKA